MGDWGNHVFDSDDADDFAGEVIVRIARELDERFRSAMTGECLGQAVPAGIAILLRLASPPINAQYTIGKKLVRYWRDAYLAHLAEWRQCGRIRECDYQEYRKNVAAVFNRLLRRAENDDWMPLDDRYPPTAATSSPQRTNARRKANKQGNARRGSRSAKKLTGGG